ncbi:MAG: TonB-dependent receptor [Planctomycetota bacterium]|nr:TonB-dependent receptor [Planctomycetota bacterium]
MRRTSHHALPRAAVGALLLAFCLGTPALAQDDPAAEEPSSPEEIPVLAPAEVVAPRLLGGVATGESETAVTPTRGRLEMLRVPHTVTVVTNEEVRIRRAARSLSGALQGLPGVLVQKTGPLQHSPFIRGFTAYNNLMLIDGIRLNNSAFRSGPNQYWATVDSLSVERFEVLRGPYSVLYGSDAIGGTVNVIPFQRTSFEPGRHTDHNVYTRYSTAEDTWFARVQTEGNQDGFGWAAGLTRKTYGNIESGGGKLPNTGGIDEWDADVRFDNKFGRYWTLSAGWQHVRQYNAPRTERTVFAVPFAGSSVGSELARDYDQERDLVYAKLAFDAGNPCCTPISRGHVAVSYHRQAEERYRLRTGDREDFQGFTVDQFGVQAQLTSPTRWGTFTYGAEYYHDEVDSFRRNFTGGVPGGPVIQGPLGDDGSYDLFGVYVQDHITFGCWEVMGGVRFTYAAAEAKRVDNPAVAGSDPTTPGNIIAVENDWTNVSGKLRAIYHMNRRWSVYGGVSQAFRTPTLHDLTSLESTSVVETPAPDLEPEKYVSFELGVKTEQQRLRAGLAGWYTILDDTIIRSPTGNLIGGVPEVRKDNIGDGWVAGIDFDFSWRASLDWTWFGTLSYMDGEVDQLDTAGTLVRRPVSRVKPLALWTGVRYAPVCSCFWAQADVEYSARADKLSLRDETDTRRIPPGGTPSWTTLNLRAGARLFERVSVSLALENLLDENYRIHGSGQNEPGRSLVFALDLDF